MPAAWICCPDAYVPNRGGQYGAGGFLLFRAVAPATQAVKESTLSRRFDIYNAPAPHLGTGFGRRTLSHQRPDVSAEQQGPANYGQHRTQNPAQGSDAEQQGGRDNQSSRHGHVLGGGQAFVYLVAKRGERVADLGRGTLRGRPRRRGDLPSNSPALSRISRTSSSQPLSNHQAPSES